VWEDERRVGPLKHLVRRLEGGAVGGYAARYRAVLAAVTGSARAGPGFPERRVAAAEARLGVRLPPALRAYYTAVGRHPLNRVSDRLRPPEAVELTGGRLVFLDENQGVVCWGVRAGGRAGPDP
jgi:hypothetical protein